MPIQPSKNRNSVFVVLAVLGLVGLSVEAENFEFRQLLSGLTSDANQSGNRKLQNKIRETLTGREQEVWEFVKASLVNSDGNYNHGDLHVGLTALFLIDGFNEDILDDYLDVLEEEASDVQGFEDLFAQRRRGELTASHERFNDLTNRTKLISVGFGVFDEYRDGLPREIATKYLSVEEPAISDKVFEWYRKHGTEEDIEALEERADELRERGDSVSVRNVESAIDAINARTDPLNERERGKAGQASIEEKGPVESASDSEKAESPTLPKWALALIAVAALGILILLIRAFLRSRGT